MEGSPRSGEMGRTGDPAGVSCLQAGAQAASILTLEPQALVCRPEAVMRRVRWLVGKGTEQCPGAVLAAFSTTRPEPSGFWEGARLEKDGLDFPTQDAQQLYPTGLWLLQLTIFSCFSCRSPLSCVCRRSVNGPCFTWPLFHLNIKSPFLLTSFFSLFCRCC